MRSTLVTTLTTLAMSAALAVVSSVTVGCGGEEKRPPQTAAAKPIAMQTTAARVAPQPMTPAPVRSGQLNVSGEIRALCNIEAPAASPAAMPHFDYDSADIHEDDRAILAQVAKCFTTGPLKGRSLRLTGHADPRGEDEYNMALGENRATVVSGYLSSLGVDPSHLQATSRGEIDAVGTDEDGWRNDRRVDLDLVK